MTKEEALFILGEMPEWDDDCRYSREEYEEVIELCRSLLVTSDTEKVTDFINREAVIDLLKQFGYYNKEMERYLSAIPSEVPEREALEKIRTDMMSYRDSVDRAISEDEFKRDGMKIAYQDCIEIIDKYIEGANK